MLIMASVEENWHTSGDPDNPLHDKLFICGGGYGESAFVRKMEKLSDFFFDKLPSTRRTYSSATLGRQGHD